MVNRVFSSHSYLLLGLHVSRLQLQNLLEAAAGCHGVAERQVALALSQVALLRSKDRWRL